MVLSFNRNIHSTSTQTFFRSTELFIPAGCKLYSTQQRTCILKLTFCKFPDIPNNIHSTTTKKFIQQTRPVLLPTLTLLGPAGLHDSYLMFLNTICRPFICFERVFYIEFVKEDFSVDWVLKPFKNRVQRTRGQVCRLWFPVVLLL